MKESKIRAYKFKQKESEMLLLPCSLAMQRQFCRVGNKTEFLADDASEHRLDLDRSSADESAFHFEILRYASATIGTLPTCSAMLPLKCINIAATEAELLLSRSP